MQIESFTEGKDLDHPEANEDCLLILPGCGYAVFDGVTDITGQSYDGMRAGWHASRAVASAVADVVRDPNGRGLAPNLLIEQASAALRELYARHGLLERARADPSRRFGATMALAVDLGAEFRFVLVGDSGLRINGAETHVIETTLDRITAAVRVEAYRLVADTGGDAAARTRIGRAFAFHGAARLHPDMAPSIDDAQRQRAYDRSFAWCVENLPGVPEADVRHMLDTGIGGQARYQNNTISPLSYAVLDGFAVPDTLVRVIERPRASVRTIELFTDGYFQPGAGPSLAEWEASFAEVERVDPEKIGRFPSVKGSTERVRADDRTVVIVGL
jgi:hypothetical protein